MARVTLDPKLDIVFKILLGSPENRDILISFLTAVLRPSSPIVKIEILNPKIPGDDDLQSASLTRLTASSTSLSTRPASSLSTR